MLAPLRKGFQLAGIFPGAATSEVRITPGKFLTTWDPATSLKFPATSKLPYVRTTPAVTRISGRSCIEISIVSPCSAPGVAGVVDVSLRRGVIIQLPSVNIIENRESPGIPKAESASSKTLKGSGGLPRGSLAVVRVDVR